MTSVGTLTMSCPTTRAGRGEPAAQLTSNGSLWTGVDEDWYVLIVDCENELINRCCYNVCPGCSVFAVTGAMLP
jgi:hypothetical protein